MIDKLWLEIKSTIFHSNYNSLENGNGTLPSYPGELVKVLETYFAWFPVKV